MAFLVTLHSNIQASKNLSLTLTMEVHRLPPLSRHDFSNCVKVLDVRSPPEVEQHGTIPGAVNINVRTLEDTLALAHEDFENQVI